MKQKSDPSLMDAKRSSHLAYRIDFEFYHQRPMYENIFCFDCNNKIYLGKTDRKKTFTSVARVER